MLLRDWFAGLAMQALCRNGDNPEATAHYSYKYADAMIAESTKERTEDEKTS